MYKANRRHLQPLLISNIQDLPEKHRERLEQSWAGVFYRETFCRLKEEPFAVLYEGLPSRPNIPVNVLVGLETLKAGFGWSDEELYDHYVFDLQVRYALGYRDLKDGEFDVRTLYNFRRRLSQYNQAQGVNLLERAFEDITDQQIQALQVKTGWQRMDSTQIASNIMDMSRLQLLVEAIQRLYRMLSEADQQRYAPEFAAYLSQSARQFAYHLKGKEATHRSIQQVGESIWVMLSKLQAGYGNEAAFQVLQRFFDDNFHVTEQSVTAKLNEEIEAGCLQSCDDLEATFRRKAEKEYKGYVANVSESCDPSNPCQLITLVQVAPNVAEDSDLMQAALPVLKQRTGLEKLNTDGGYGSPDLDQALHSLQVEHIPTAIKGRQPDPAKLGLAAYAIQVDAQGLPTQLTCPHGQVGPVRLGAKKSAFLADFDPRVCQNCPFHLAGQCRAKPGKRDPHYHLDFNLHETQVARRRQAKDQQKHSGHNLRAAVEATMRSIKHAFPGGKLPVRGLFRMTSMMIASALMCNVRSILRFLQAQRKLEKSSRAGQPSASSHVFDPILAALSTLLCRLSYHWVSFSC